MGIAEDILAVTVTELDGSGIDLTNAPVTNELLAALSAGVASVISGGQRFFVGTATVTLSNTGSGTADATITHDLGKPNTPLSVLIANYQSGASFLGYMLGVSATHQDYFDFCYWSPIAQTLTINYLLAYND